MPSWKIPGTNRCSCCGLENCVCDDRAFESCVRDRDRDSIIELIAERMRLEKEAMNASA